FHTFNIRIPWVSPAHGDISLGRASLLTHLQILEALLSSLRPRAPIHLHDGGEVAARRPLMIPHRGGVIASDAPENSARAIELAAQQGYDMVELDVRRARDGVPVVFHGSGSKGMMLVDCGIHESIGH